MHSHTESHIHTSNTWNKYKLRFIKEQLTSKEEVGYTVLELSLYHREGIAEHTVGRAPGEICLCGAAVYREMGLVTMTDFRLRECLFWERGPPELSKGGLHTTPKILLLGLTGPARLR